MSFQKSLSACSVIALCAACAQTGALSVTTWGEEFIEQGIPADEFADGWAVTFSKFALVISSVQVEDDAGNALQTFTAPATFDLTQPGPVQVVDLGEVEAKRYARVGAVVQPDDVLGGSSVVVEGEASKGADAFTFSWSFATATRYSGCESEDGEGIVVRAGEQNEMQLTVHGDHLFYDDLAADDAVLRADAIFAADADADGEVTQAELSDVDLTTLPIDQYGNAGAAETLGDFITSLSRTLIHLDGEGECSISAP